MAVVAAAAVEAAAGAAAAGEHVVSRHAPTDLGDSVMTAIAIAPLSTVPCRFANLGVLRKQECERVQALRTELTKCGASVVEEGDTLSVACTAAAQLGSATVHTYHDHRMAMCFATLGLAVGGVKLEDPSCVRKTVPSFFQILAAPPPRGLGAEVYECDPTSGARVRRLTEPADLFAEAPPKAK